MLVSHRKKFIYTKTIKTAGTSIESYFEKYCMPEGSWTFQHACDEHICSEGIIGYRGSRDNLKEQQYYNHMSAVDIKKKVGTKIWDDYYKFCVVRNPFDKLVSGFYFSVRDPSGSVDGFRQWLKNGGETKDQNAYLINGEVAVDYFIRYEDLHQGVKHVCAVLGIPFDSATIPKLKTQFRNRTIPLDKFYDKETIQIVKERYRFELEYFDYSLPL